MARFLRKDKKEIGLSPDQLFFRGDQKNDQVAIQLIDFSPLHLEEKPLTSLQEIIDYPKKDAVSWINIDGLHDLAVVEALGRQFTFDRLILADVLNTQARPKVQEYSNCLYVSIKMLQLDNGTGQVKVENLSLILTQTTLISFQEKAGDVFDAVRERIRKQKRRIRNSGADYLMFALLDIVIDHYLYIISFLGEKIETLEDSLLHDPDQDIIEEINAYKRELNFIRRNIKPAREMIFTLCKLESDLIRESTEIHLKELQDNINQASDSSDSYREILSDQLNIYHTTISTRLNDIMKFLTIFSVIFIPLTFIAGIYGTNFDVMPELHYEYSYYIMLGIMLIVVIFMLFYFKKRRWL